MFVVEKFQGSLGTAIFGPLTARYRAWVAGDVSDLDRVIAGFAGFVTGLCMYFVAAIVNANRVEAQHQVPTAIDAWIGLIPASVLVYGLLYPQVVTPLLLVVKRHMLVRAGIAYMVVIAAGLPFWLLWPVGMERSELPVTDLFSYGVALIRWIDPPVNCFPSMHVAETYFAAFLTLRLNRRIGRLMIPVATAIWWSTLALDQHWFLDGLAGLGLAFVVDRIAFGSKTLTADDFESLGPRRLLGSLAFYIFLFGLFAAPYLFGWVDGTEFFGRWGG